MSIEDFKKYKFSASTRISHKGIERDLMSINFEEALIGMIEICSGCDDGNLEWVRCENVVIISE